MTADAQVLFDGYTQDAEVARFMTWRPHTSIEETQAFVDGCVMSRTARTYLLEGQDDGRLRGVFELRRPAPHRLGYGYLLGSVVT